MKKRHGFHCGVFINKCVFQTVWIPVEHGAPHGGAALVRRTSVFAWGENLGAGGIDFRRELK